MKLTILRAAPEDAAELLRVQKRAFKIEAERNQDPNIAPMVEKVEETIRAFSSHTIWKAVMDGEIAGSVRTRKEAETCHIGRLFVSPDRQGLGIGKSLMRHAEEAFSSADSYQLITGGNSLENIRLYENLGYRIIGEKFENRTTRLVVMEKARKL